MVKQFQKKHKMRHCTCMTVIKHENKSETSTRFLIKTTFVEYTHIWYTTTEYVNVFDFWLQSCKLWTAFSLFISACDNIDVIRQNCVKTFWVGLFQIFSFHGFGNANINIICSLFSVYVCECFFFTRDPNPSIIGWRLDLSWKRDWRFWVRIYFYSTQKADTILHQCGMVCW